MVLHLLYALISVFLLLRFLLGRQHHNSLLPPSSVVLLLSTDSPFHFRSSRILSSLFAKGCFTFVLLTCRSSKITYGASTIFNWSSFCDFFDTFCAFFLIFRFLFPSYLRATSETLLIALKKVPSENDFGDGKATDRSDLHL
ncbi:hypothetical protein QR680_012516 [Steinernema hermaphroditum]|uniref:Uncharacterized protein n=1 Tax=Steinernema hermaphroditum TaxID=289476 RepID=A0AA39I3V1_9BILA|nr:hypothetical protein QR680_012516 [Steinernema hermaphroditum]